MTELAALRYRKLKANLIYHGCFVESEDCDNRLLVDEGYTLYGPSFDEAVDALPDEPA